jgi:hypothetical protein
MEQEHPEQQHLGTLVDAEAVLRAGRDHRPAGEIENGGIATAVTETAAIAPPAKMSLFWSFRSSTHQTERQTANSDQKFWRTESRHPDCCDERPLRSRLGCGGKLRASMQVPHGRRRSPIKITSKPQLNATFPVRPQAFTLFVKTFHSADRTFIPCRQMKGWKAADSPGAIPLLGKIERCNF